MITAENVKELREKTGLGMMVCKKALTEANGNMEVAIENLRKQGQATMEKRAGKAANEGKISIVESGNAIIMYEVNSETDFVARNDDFVAFSEALGSLLLDKQPSTLEEANALAMPSFGGISVADKLIELTGKIGEKIGFRRFAIIKSEGANQALFCYSHGTRIGVVVKLWAAKPEALSSEAASSLGKDLAMQVAAANPIAVSIDQIPAELVAKEKDIYFTQAQTSGKPEKIWDKIVEGKLSKFYKDIVLVEQEFIKDPDLSVSNRIEQAAKECGSELKAVAFVRYELGGGEQQ
jgi:elongation factor Ts